MPRDLPDVSVPAMPQQPPVDEPLPPQPPSPPEPPLSPESPEPASLANPPDMPGTGFAPDSTLPGQPYRPRMPIVPPVFIGGDGGDPPWGT